MKLKKFRKKLKSFLAKKLEKLEDSLFGKPKKSFLIQEEDEAFDELMENLSWEASIMVGRKITKEEVLEVGRKGGRYD